MRMRENIQPSTFKLQRRRDQRGGKFVRCWALNVECSVFLLLALSAFSQSNTNSPPALAPPYGEMPPTFWEAHGVTVLIAGPLLVLAAGLGLWWMLHPRPPAIVPPETQARQALSRLMGRPEDGNCLSEVSRILRSCLGAMLGLPPGELTTTEFCAALAGRERVGAAPARDITGFLLECDARKFSPAGPSAPLGAAARALELIDLAKQPLNPGRTAGVGDT